MTSRVSIPLAICVVGAIVAIALLGRSGSSPGPAPAATAPAAAATVADEPTAATPADTPTIRIEGFAFDQGIQVAAGQTVQVVNVDGAPHTLTADDRSFDTGVLSGGASGTFTAPTAPGTYSFFCELHPSMTGTFTVSG